MPKGPSVAKAALVLLRCSRYFSSSPPIRNNHGLRNAIVQHIRFSPAPEYLAKLQVAIQEAHGCVAKHEATWMGVEYFGPLIWSGSVEVFRLPEGSPAPRAFAWSKVEGDHLHCFIVLENEEISSPRAAVRHVLAEQCAEPDEAQAA